MIDPLSLLKNNTLREVKNGISWFKWFFQLFIYKNQKSQRDKYRHLILPVR